MGITFGISNWKGTIPVDKEVLNKVNTDLNVLKT